MSDSFQGFMEGKLDSGFPFIVSPHEHRMWLHPLRLVPLLTDTDGICYLNSNSCGTDSDNRNRFQPDGA
jgi:hypothetical protein